MSSPTGAHGEADATKQENEQQPQSTASTDATLNARAKSSNGAKSQGPKKWLIALIAIIAAVAVIVALPAAFAVTVPSAAISAMFLSLVVHVTSLA